jgi:hypothetical protein
MKVFRDRELSDDRDDLQTTGFFFQRCGGQFNQVFCGKLIFFPRRISTVVLLPRQKRQAIIGFTKTDALLPELVTIFSFGKPY